MADYFHPALRGDQLHEAKIRVLPAGSSFPVPQWEGQLLVLGLNLYISITQNGALNWIQPRASNTPQLPANVVTFEQGFSNPTPRASTLSGIIYTNTNTNDVYYLSRGQWIKLGMELTFDKLFIQNSSDSNLVIPTNGTVNAVFLRTWEPNKKYYFRFEAPAVSTLSQNATTNYYIELRFSNVLLGSNVVSSFLTFDTTGLQVRNDLYKIMVYFKGTQGQNIYCNFFFDLDSRLITVQGLATVFFF